MCVYARARERPSLAPALPPHALTNDPARSLCSALCPGGWDLVSGRCIRVSTWNSTNEFTYTSAESACQRQIAGGHLAKVTTFRTIAYIKSKSASGDCVRIGATRDASGWVWPDGSRATNVVKRKKADAVQTKSCLWVDNGGVYSTLRRYPDSAIHGYKDGMKFGCDAAAGTRHVTFLPSFLPSLLAWTLNLK